MITLLFKQTQKGWANIILMKANLYPEVFYTLGAQP